MAIKLPMDANGRVIPLDTNMMYRNDNSQFHVTDFFYEARPDKWFARSGSECIKVDELYLEIKQEDSLEKPDSPIRLAESLKRVMDAHERGKDYLEAACDYADRVGKDCSGCPLYDKRKSCADVMMEDIVSRVNRLCGDAE